ncbi:MAG: hypothetical protein IKE74_05355 [Mogibacterium sp.]|nr:hypothetical protein [Mogibacterium sp.]
MSEKNSLKTVIEMIVLAVIIAVAVYLFMNSQGQSDLGAAAANARVPLGEAFGNLLAKYF